MDDYDENVFKNKIDEIKKDQDEAKEYQEYCRFYKIFETISDVNKMKVPDMMKLYAKDYQHPEELEKIPKYKNGFIITIILDDLLGTKAFKLGRNYLTNCRHTAGGLNFCKNSRGKWRKCISVTGSLRGQAQGRPIDKVDGACTNADDRMMLVQHCSGDCVMS